MSPATQIAGKVLSNKYFWMTVGAIILIVVTKKIWNKVSDSFQADFGEYDDPALQPERKDELEELARDTHTKIYEVEFGIGSLGWGGSALGEEDLIALDELTDRELKYVAKFYKRALTRGVSLYKDIHREWLPFTDMDEIVMVRLAQIGQKI